MFFQFESRKGYVAGQGERKVEIKAKCKHDLDSMKALIHIWMFKEANPKTSMLGWSIIFGFVLTNIILQMILSPSITRIPALLVVIGGYFLICDRYFLLPKRQYKSMVNMKDIEQQFIFGDQVLIRTCKNDRYNSQSELEYSLLVKVYETSKYLFLFQTIREVIIVDKSTIEGGTIQDIRKVLSNCIKGKYTICTY